MPEDPSVPPLVRKLGLKPGMRACVLDAPPHYARLLAPLPAGVTLQEAPAENLAFIQVFVGDRGALQRAFALLTPHLASDGMLWMCWPKQSSTLAADFTGTDVRRAGLAAGLVDVKYAPSTPTGPASSSSIAGPTAEGRGVRHPAGSPVHRRPPRAAPAALPGPSRPRRR